MIAPSRSDESTGSDAERDRVAAPVADAQQPQRAEETAGEERGEDRGARRRTAAQRAGASAIGSSGRIDEEVVRAPEAAAATVDGAGYGERPASTSRDACQKTWKSNP